MPLILYVLLGLLSVIWGSSFYFIAILVEPFGPWGVTFLRCTCGALVLLAVVLVRRKTLRLGAVPWWKLIAIGLLNSAIPWSLIAFSQTMINSGTTSVLNAFTPIWTVILGMVWFQSKSTWRQWLGVVAGFVGILVLLDIDAGTLRIDHPIAVVAMMLTTLCYGFGAHLSKKYLGELSVYLISFVTLAAGGLFAGAFMWWTRPLRIEAIFEVQPLIAIVGLGVFGSGIAYMIYYTILQRGSAEFTTTVTYLVPLFAICWGYVLLDEPLSRSLLGGLALILIGVYLSGRNKPAAARPER